MSSSSGGSRAVVAAARDRGCGGRGGDQPGGAAELTAALAADPGALICGAPPVAGRLAIELIARGSVALTVPACAACGRIGRPLFRGDNGEGVCQRCRAWQRAEPCATCGKLKPVTGRNSAGRPVCEV